MPSAALFVWNSDRPLRLDEVEAQCAACAAQSPTNMILYEEDVRACILLLSAHFQGFCRDLYTECAQIVASKVRPTLQILVQEQFAANAALDHGNPNINNIKADFNRLGMSLDLAKMDPANHARLSHLRELNTWRNIAAHHKALPTSGLPSLGLVQSWRSSCSGLAASLDGIMYNHLRRLLRRPPWAP